MVYGYKTNIYRPLSVYTNKVNNVIKLHFVNLISLLSH